MGRVEEGNDGYCQDGFMRKYYKDGYDFWSAGGRAGPWPDMSQISDEECNRLCLQDDDCTATAYEVDRQNCALYNAPCLTLISRGHRTYAKTDCDSPVRCELSDTEHEFLMWDRFSCQEMQDNWGVCMNEEDFNHHTIMQNCPSTCAMARNEPCPIRYKYFRWIPTELRGCRSTGCGCWLELAEFMMYDALGSLVSWDTMSETAGGCRGDNAAAYAFDGSIDGTTSHGLYATGRFTAWPGCESSDRGCAALLMTKDSKVDI